MRNNLFLGVAAIALVAPAAAMAQETTSTIRGTVTAGGAPVAGATVVATNTSNGGRSQTTTDANGGFSLSGLLPGGPYSVEVTSAQGNTTVTDISTVVQQTYELPIELAEAGGTDIVVTAASIRGAGTTSDGPQSVFTQEDIRKVASVNRDVRDILRRDPLATLDPTNTRAVSVAGVNPRFNRFTINGVQVGDNFGLNSDANPTGRGPIPFDALAQVSLSIAPYDIRQGNFQGAAIDTIMLSGTNDFHGTGFYSQSTDGLQGDRIGSTVFNKAKYKSETYGATLRGPIIADKLFFMVSAERNTDPRPLAVGSIAQVPGLTAAQVTQVQDIAQRVYGYDTGDFLGLNNQKDEKIVGKIDWNITTGQRLSLSYINAYESSTVAQNTSTNATTPSLGLQSNYYQRSVLLRAGIVQLNSDWTDQLSTEIRGYYKSNRVGQDPLLGRGFAQFGVCLSPTSTIATTGGDTAQACATGTPRVFFGPDLSRQANELFFDTWGGSVLTRYTAEDHDIKLLAEVNANRTYNYFLQRVAGVYYFDSIQDFENRNASQFDYANAVSLNPRDAAADFRYQQYTFGLQDDWSITDTLTLTYGARYDVFAMRSPIAANDAFFRRNGFYNTKNYKGLDNFQPRISFNWKPTSDLRIRGGVGIFGGGSPDIYLSNSYSNTGVLTNRISTITRTTPVNGGATLTCASPYNTAALNAVCTAALNGVTGTSIPGVVNQYLSTNTGALATATVNALAPDFRLPSVTKATLSADYRLFGFNVGADYIFSMVNQGVDFTDLRSVQIGVLPDGRPRYNFRPTPGAGAQSGDTNSDILIFNNGKGRSHIGTVRFNKDTDFGLSFGGSYSLQDIRDVNSASSSVAASNYGNNPMSDPNRSQYGISNNQITWAFKYNLGFEREFFGDNRTIIQLFGETRAGRRYSYTMQNSVARSPVFGTLTNVSSDSPDQRFLLYVPTGATDPIVSYDNAQTQADLEALIGRTELSKYRGRIAPKNIARSRAFTRIDLHLEQEFPTFIGDSKISLFADIENLPNLLNSDWGGLRQLGFPNYAPVVQVSCLQAAAATGAPGTATTSPTQPCAQYRYSSFRAPNDSVPSTVNSLYLIRVGARFSF